MNHHRSINHAYCINLRPSLLALCLTLLTAWHAATQAVEPEVIKTIANGTTTCIVTIDTARIQLPQLGPAQQLNSLLDELRQATGNQPLYVAIDLPFRTNSSFVRLMAKTRGVGQDQLKQFLQKVNNRFDVSEPSQVGEWTVVELLDPGANSDSHESPISNELLPLDLERWTAAINDLADYPVQLTVVPPSYFRRAYLELDPEFPASLGGGSGRMLAEGLQWLHFACDPQTMKAKLLVQSEDEQAATALAKHVPKMLRGMIEGFASQMESSKGMLLAMVGLVQLQVEGSQIAWNFEEAESTENLLALGNLVIRTGASPIATNQSSNNLKQLGLAIHNYIDNSNVFPPNAKARGADGHSGLSWRVHILPYIDQVELYRRFKLDEAWDSPHNIQLLKEMPQVFAPVTVLGESSGAKPFHTLYAAPVGEKTIFGGEKPVSFSMITDGTSNTILFVELAPEHAIPWTSPEEYRFDPKAPAAKLNVREGKTLTGFADGSVRRLQPDNTPEIWRALFSMSGGEMTKEK